MTNLQTLVNTGRSDESLGSSPKTTNKSLKTYFCTKTELAINRLIRQAKFFSLVSCKVSVTYNIN